MPILGFLEVTLTHIWNYDYANFYLCYELNKYLKITDFVNVFDF